MGIWDFTSRTTDSLKRNAPDLTAVKNCCPTPGSLNRIAPDVTAAKNLCSTVYGYGSATVTQIGNAVRGNVNQYLYDEEARSKMLRFGTNSLKHSANEGLKIVPGYKIVTRSLRDMNESNKQEVDVKALQADLHCLKKEFSDYRKVHEPKVDVKALQADPLRLEKELVDTGNQTSKVHMDSVLNQKPEDVIRVFMMKEFMGRHFLDNLIDPRGKPRKK